MGHLKKRQDLNAGYLEEFFYEEPLRDSLYRLEYSELTTPSHPTAQNLNVDYDQIGNITYKVDVGNYSYSDAGHKHAVTAAGGNSYAYDANGNMIQRNGKTVGWTTFNKPASMILDAGNFTLLKYGPDRQRFVLDRPDFPGDWFV